MRRLALAILFAILASVALGRSEGIYNPSSNAIGDGQGIDSNLGQSVATTGSALLVDNINPALLIDNTNPACLAGGC